MQAAQRARIGADGIVDLHEAGFEAMPSKFLGAEEASEEPAVVPARFQRHHKRSFHGGRLVLHGSEDPPSDCEVTRADKIGRIEHAPYIDGHLTAQIECGERKYSAPFVMIVTASTPGFTHEPGG